MPLNNLYLKNKFKLIVEPVIRRTGRGKRFLPEKRFWELLYKNFPPTENFHFIQVGANDGISFDILYDVVKERQSKGVVIEPLEDFYKKLCVNYKDFPGIIKVNKAAHPSLNEVSLFRVDPQRQSELASWAAGIASLDPLHHKKSGTASEYIVEEKVTALPLMKIISDAGTGDEVDLLQIDVEGFDYEILKMVDFNKLKPKIIKYEFSNLSPADIKQSQLLLKSKGYYLFPIADDMIAILLGIIRL